MNIYNELISMSLLNLTNPLCFFIAPNMTISSVQILSSHFFAHFRTFCLCTCFKKKSEQPVK